MTMTPQQQASRQEQRERFQRWGQAPEGKACLAQLCQRYPALRANQVAPTWEEQHLKAGQQQVLADLTKLFETGEM